MLYYTHEARNSAVDSIHDCIKKISRINGTELSYTDAATITRFLSMLEDEIVKEDKKTRR